MTSAKELGLFCVESLSAAQETFLDTCMNYIREHYNIVDRCKNWSSYTWYEKEESLQRLLTENRNEYDLNYNKVTTVN